MKRSSKSLWKEFEAMLEDLAERMAIDEILVTTIEDIIKKVNMAMTLDEPCYEHLEILEILGSESYRKNMIAKVSKEDFMFMLKVYDEYLVVSNIIKREDNELLMELETRDDLVDKVPDKNLPKGDVTYEELYGKQNKGIRDYLFG